MAANLTSHMIQTGEWGQMMPASMSPFGYNESVAYEYYPLTKEEAHAEGLTWKEDSEKKQENDGYQPLSIDQYDELVV